MKTGRISNNWGGYAEPKVAVRMD